MFKTYSSSSSLVIISRWFATSRLRAPVSVRLVYYRPQLANWSPSGRRLIAAWSPTKNIHSLQLWQLRLYWSCFLVARNSLQYMCDSFTHITWWRHQMETFSALLDICAGNSPVPGEFPAQRPVTQSFDVFFDLRLNKRLSKQSWGWWFETLPRPLWRHSNECDILRPRPWALTQNFATELSGEFSGDFSAHPSSWPGVCDGSRGVTYVSGTNWIKLEQFCLKNFILNWSGHKKYFFQFKIHPSYILWYRNASRITGIATPHPPKKSYLSIIAVRM